MSDDPLAAELRRRTELMEAAHTHESDELEVCATGRSLYLLLVIAGSTHVALSAPSAFTAQYLDHMKQASRALETLRKLWGLGT